MLLWLEFLAVASAAAYGILLGCRKELDAVGVFFVALVMSFGGGTLRDLLLGRRPLFWVANDHYLLLVVAITLVAAFVPGLVARLERWLWFPDALGLGLFSIVGAGFALEAGTSAPVAVLMGVITGTFGGVLGEIVCNEIPSLFRPATFYATCSVGGIVIFLLLLQWPVTKVAAPWVGTTFVVIFRMAALRWNWRLKPIRLPGPPPG